MSQYLRAVCRWSWFVFSASQVLLYALFYLSTRSAAQAHLPSALVCDGFYAAVQFFAIRRISASDNAAADFTGYLIGSLIGTAAGIQCSVWLLGS